MQMNFHPDKCHVLHLGHSKPQNNNHMNNTSGNIHMLDAVTSEKDLGVTIDQQLKFLDVYQEHSDFSTKTHFYCSTKQWLDHTWSMRHMSGALIWKKTDSHWASSAASNMTCAGNKGITIQRQTKRITASYPELPKTEQT